VTSSYVRIDTFRCSLSALEPVFSIVTAAQPVSVVDIVFAFIACVAGQALIGVVTAFVARQAGVSRYDTGGILFVSLHKSLPTGMHACCVECSIVVVQLFI
jgi:hypothetical protein